MDLIYTDSNREDIGVLHEYDFDLAFGADENSFECRIQATAHCCNGGGYLYCEGTEYGGIIDSITSETDTREVVYAGRTWHGILNSKILCPTTGSSYMVVSGEANAVLARIISTTGLTSLFTASGEDSGVPISNYQMDRYIGAYDGIRKMLASYGLKLKIAYNGGMVVLSAQKVVDYSESGEFDADRLSLSIKQNFNQVNHLICLGSGTLASRMIYHLYANAKGIISTTQTFTGPYEVAAVYDYPNVESQAELIRYGKERFKELREADTMQVDVESDSGLYDVGDIVGGRDDVTGILAAAEITKKIVTIKSGQMTISYKVGE